MPAYDADLFLPPAPVARVILRSPQTRQTISDIPLLIDSGADVTLVSQSAVNQLGITIDAAETYQVQSFDQQVSTAHAVNLELRFLNRTFRGKFLIIDQEVGILGRDILNHVLIGAGWTGAELARIKMNRVVLAKANDDFSLDLRFDDGRVKRFDMKPYLSRGVFRELQAKDYFKQVSIAYGTVQWPNEQDISADTLYLEGVDIQDSSLSNRAALELAEQTK